MVSTLKTTPAANPLASRYVAVRKTTEALVAPLEPEDTVVQSMPDVSPAKWHLAQQVVEFTGHEEALHDFRDAANSFLERGQLRVHFAMQGDEDKYIARQSGLRLVEQRNVAIDQACFLEGADAAQAGGFRQVHAGSKLDVAGAPVVLQRREYGLVVAIECHGRNLSENKRM